MNKEFNEKINSIINDIMKLSNPSNNEAKMTNHLFLDMKIIVKLIEGLKIVLFPAHFSAPHFANQGARGMIAMRYELNSILINIYSTLVDQITKALPYKKDFERATVDECRLHAEAQVAIFIDKLPIIREYLETDLQAAFEGDPAAQNKDDIVYCYPGFFAIMVNRMAHELYLLNIPMIPRIMTEYAHSLTGVDIHPGATIGKYFFIDHGTGVVIGETSIIGDRVKMYQGVTLGGLSTRAGQGLKGVKRHPTIGDGVTIYSNASILGGETIIGCGCTIAGNSFITRSIPPNMRVSNKQNELVIVPDPRAITDTCKDWEQK